MALSKGEGANVTVSDHTVNLWSQVLSEPVMVPEWELDKAPDIMELIDKKLIKVSGCCSPTVLLVLANPALALSYEEKKLLKLMVLIMAESKAEKIDITKVLLPKALEYKIAYPLRAILRLVKLNLVSYDKDDKRFTLPRVSSYSFKE